MKREQLEQRYLTAAHAVQAGVAMELNDNPPSNSGSPCSPKMLRTGANQLRGMIRPIRLRVFGYYTPCGGQ